MRIRSRILAAASAAAVLAVAGITLFASSASAATLTEVTRSGKCFDVSSPQALKRGAGSDPVGIMSMVTYVQQHNNADPGRIFVTGASSGGMMTNVLLGDYPDVFKAGAAFMGVPFGCFATTDGSSWNSTCSRTSRPWWRNTRTARP